MPGLHLSPLQLQRASSLLLSGRFSDWLWGNQLPSQGQGINSEAWNTFLSGPFASSHHSLFPVLLKFSSELPPCGTCHIQVYL